MSEIVTYGGNQPTGSTYYSNPNLVQSLAGSLGSTAGSAANSYMPLLSNVTQNPLYQSQLQGLMQSLQPSEQRATTGLQDMFRSAGMTNSGAFAQQASNLQRDILNNRTQAAGKLAGDSFNSIATALNNPMSQIDGLIKALTLNQESRYVPPSVTNTSSGGGDFLSGTSSFNSANDPYFQNAAAQTGQASPGGGSYGAIPQRSAGPGSATGGATNAPHEIAYSGGTSYMSDGTQRITDQAAYQAAMAGYPGMGTGQSAQPAGISNDNSMWNNMGSGTGGTGLATVNGQPYQDPFANQNWNPNPVMQDNQPYQFSDYSQQIPDFLDW